MVLPSSFDPGPAATVVPARSGYVAIAVRPSVRPKPFSSALTAALTEHFGGKPKSAREPPPPPDPEALLRKPFLTTAELAAVLGVKVNTLEKWRREKRGPLVAYFGGAPRYERAEVLAYLERRKLSSTERRHASDEWGKNGVRGRRSRQ